MEGLLGKNLLEKNNQTIATNDALSGKIVGLYFSAHWCPPCRNFTPQFAKFYNNLKAKGTQFEVVFVSSDGSEEEFNSYFSEMPWLALPFSEEEQKEKLSSKFEIDGIPSLIILDVDGTTISPDAVELVMSDPEGKEFPWRPKEFFEVLGDKLIRHDDSGKIEEVTVQQTLREADKKKALIGVYFSAHWCPPCRAFTPRLVETYKHLKAAGKPFEIIFASSDRDEKSFLEYFKTMPWLALPFDVASKRALSKKFNVSGIPTFVLLDGNGNLVSKNGRANIERDPKGENFPWTS
jgi:nucleoredoxin